MERLTARDSRGKVYMLLNSESKNMTEPINLHDFYMLAERLAIYEDAERDGRLVVLPCKVGDTIYEASLRVKCAGCPDNHAQKCKAHTGECIRENKWLITEMTFNVDCYSLHTKSLYRGLYLTREEAEAALAAQKGARIS